MLSSGEEQPFCHFLPFSIYAVFPFRLHVSIFLFFCYFSTPSSPPSSSSFHVICFFFFFFGFFFFSSVLIQILGPPSPNFCRAAPFVRQCNVLETTDSQHREIVPRVC